MQHWAWIGTRLLHRPGRSLRLREIDRRQQARGEREADCMCSLLGWINVLFGGRTSTVIPRDVTANLRGRLHVDDVLAVGGG